MKTLSPPLWLATILFLNFSCGHENQNTHISPSASLINHAVDSEVGTRGINPVVGAIKLPAGYQRVGVTGGSFGEYLRDLQIKPDDHVVNLFNGRKKANQRAHYSILNVDVGPRDLQQCADAVIRLRAEYLYQMKAFEKITFNFTNGEPVPFKKYAEGYRVKIDDNRIYWKKRADKDYSYPNFRKYLDLIFAYAGSYSLEKELSAVTDIDEIRIGDVFIQGGFPGHAVLVMDMAKHAQTGKKIFLLAQSYMPAQEIHILVNPNHLGISPWYSIPPGKNIYTPEWTFNKTNLKRWGE